MPKAKIVGSQIIEKFLGSRCVAKKLKKNHKGDRHGIIQGRYGIISCKCKWFQRFSKLSLFKAGLNLHILPKIVPLVKYVVMF